MKRWRFTYRIAAMMLLLWVAARPMGVACGGDTAIAQTSMPASSTSEEEAVRQYQAKKQREYQEHLRLREEYRAANAALMDEVRAKSTCMAGTDTAFGSLRDLYDKFKAGRSDVPPNLLYMSGGDEVGIAELTAGRAEAAVVRESLTEPQLKRLKDAFSGREIKEIPYCRTALVFVVHAQNGVPSLTLRQIEDIYRGKGEQRGQEPFLLMSAPRCRGCPPRRICGRVCGLTVPCDGGRKALWPGRKRGEKGSGTNGTDISVTICRFETWATKYSWDHSWCNWPVSSQNPAPGAPERSRSVARSVPSAKYLTQSMLLKGLILMSVPFGSGTFFIDVGAPVPWLSATADLWPRLRLDDPL